MSAELKGSGLAQVLEGPNAVITTALFLTRLIREMQISELHRLDGMDTVSAAILTKKVDPEVVMVADRTAIARATAAENRMHSVI